MSAESACACAQITNQECSRLALVVQIGAVCPPPPTPFQGVSMSKLSMGCPDRRVVTLFMGGPDRRGLSPPTHPLQIGNTVCVCVFVGGRAGGRACVERIISRVSAPCLVELSGRVAAPCLQAPADLAFPSSLPPP